MVQTKQQKIRISTARLARRNACLGAAYGGLFAREPLRAVGLDADHRVSRDQCVGISAESIRSTAAAFSHWEG